MQKLYINPSDARSWRLCKRRVWYDNFPPNSDKIAPLSEFDKLVTSYGIAHENEIKNLLQNERKLIEATSSKNTQALMAENVDIIYQPIIEDELKGIKGNPDFLIRNEKGHYQAADAKFKQSADEDEITIQLGSYRILLNNSLPALVYLQDKSTVEIGDESKTKADEFLRDMPGILQRDNPPEARYGETKCNSCPYVNICKPEFEAKEELTLLYGLDSRCAPYLEQNGLITISELSKADPSSIPDVPYLKGFEKKQRAVKQAQAYFSAEPYQINSFTLPEGTWVHFDIEDNQFTQMKKKACLFVGFFNTFL